MTNGAKLRKRLRSWSLALAMLLGGANLEASTSSWWEALKETGRQNELLVTHYSSKALWGDEFALQYAGLHFRRLFQLPTKEGSSPYAIFLSAHVEGIHEGPGDYLAGGSAGLRWTRPLGQDGLAFYAQASIGVLGNDVYKDHTQRSFGSFLEFRDNFTLGLSYPLPRGGGRLVFLEVSVEHISNAGIAEPNGGINTFGVSLGLSR